MRTRNGNAALALAALIGALAAPSAAQAALARVGPMGQFGFPEWFQDNTGVTLELCAPATVQEATDGWCLAAPPDLLSDEVYPTNFSDEHFWWSGEALGTYNGDRLLLVLGVEATYAGGAVVRGDEVAFGRLRIRLDTVPVTGIYTFVTPYGTFEEPGVAGDRIFATRDLGLTGCLPGDFSCVLNSDIGPFLLPSDAPGGAELPPVRNPATGKLHIAPGGYVGPVTGSPTGTNYFEVIGPPGAPDPVRVTDFAVTGRIFEGGIPAQATVDRATYTRTATTRAVEGFVSAFPTQPGRLPASPLPQAVTPQLDFYSVPCGTAANGDPIAPAGGAPVAMSRTGSAYWAKTSPAAIPNDVCVAYTNPTTGTGEVAPPIYTRAPLGDQVLVDEAIYSASTRTLTVRATSLDAVNDPALELAGFGGLGPWPLTDGSVVISNVNAPPAKVRVTSEVGGSNALEVSSFVRPATGVTLTSSVPSPSAPGAEVVFTAAGQGAAGYQYRFWLDTGAGPAIVQDYGVGSAWSLPASTPSGAYRVIVHVRTSPAVAFDARAELTHVLVAPATAVTLAASVPSPGIKGSPTPIVFTATAQGSSNYQYRFFLVGATGGLMVRDYAASPSWTLPATTPVGTYNVVVHVRTTPGVALDARGELNYVLREAPAAGVTIAADKASPQVVGTPVVFTAAGQGSSGYQYRFWLDSGTGPAIVQDYGVGSAWILPTSTPEGTYRVIVHVRTSAAAAFDARAELSYTVRVAAATGVTMTSDLASPQVVGTPVVFTAVGQGSSGYQYRFWLDSGTGPAIVQDYGVGSAWSLPTSTPAGTYRVIVHVRTSAASAFDARAELSYTVRLAAATGVTMTSDLASPQVVGTPVVFTAAGQGSSGYQYRFWLDNGTGPTIVQDYGVGSAFTVPLSTPAGTYRVIVHVRTSAVVAFDARAEVAYTLTPGL